MTTLRSKEKHSFTSAPRLAAFDARERLSLADRATQLLRDRILDLTLAPGLPLDEKSLIERFDVGRTPMREALNRLMSEGLIETRETRGFFVTSMNLQDSVQLLDAYVMSERMVASLVNFDHPALIESLEILNDALRRFTREGDILSVTAGNAEFHRVLATATGNEHVAQFSNHLHNLARRLSYYIYLSEKSRIESSAPLSERPLDDHCKIIDALRERNREVLIDIVGQHSALFRLRLSKVIEGAMLTDISFDTFSTPDPQAV